MPRPRKSTPSYLKHPSGQARMVWTDATGRRYKLLPGPYNSPESLQAFHRLSLELAITPTAPVRVATGPTVAEVLLAYLRHATEYYGPDATELFMVKDALRPVRELYGLTPAAEFGPLALSAVREAMVGKGWCRPYVNRQTAKVVRAFKWAAGRELILPAVHTALKTLEPLKRGRTAAPEPTPRTAADPAVVAATLPFLPPHVRALIEVVRLTGMRPSEACKMTLGEVDRSGDVWVYSPKKHKNEHRGKGRPVSLGPVVQAVIMAHLGGIVLGPDEPLFSPRRQRDERFVELRAKRKTKVPPSQVSRKKAKPKRQPGEWFTYHTVGHAVKVACRKAGVAEWTPYQLRHLRAAEVRTAFGIEHAKAVLGHSAVGMTEHYAKSADAVLAAEVATKVG